MTLAVRPYDPTDREGCWLVFYRAVREGAAGFYDEAQRAAWAPEPLPALDGHDKLLAGWTFVATRAGHITGFMTLEPSGHLDMAFVLPEEMGHGTAGAIYTALLAKARAEGLLRLTVQASHLARRFFARQGWAVDREEKLAADGQIYEVFRMSLDLTQTGTRHD